MMDEFKEVTCICSIAFCRKVLASVDQTRKDAKTTRFAIKNITANFENAKVQTAQLLQKLTARATVLEKLKAKVGIATSLSAFLQLNELSDEEEEEDDLLKEGKYPCHCGWEGQDDT